MQKGSWVRVFGSDQDNILPILKCIRHIYLYTKISLKLQCQAQGSGYSCCSLWSPRTFMRRAGASWRTLPFPCPRQSHSFSSVSWPGLCEVLSSSAAQQLSNSAACKHFHSMLRSLLLSLSSSVPCTFECKILNYDGSCFSIKGATGRRIKTEWVSAKSIKSLPLTATWTHSCHAWVSKCGTTLGLLYFRSWTVPKYFDNARLMR